MYRWSSWVDGDGKQEVEQILRPRYSCKVSRVLMNAMIPKTNYSIYHIEFVR